MNIKVEDRRIYTNTVNEILGIKDEFVAVIEKSFKNVYKRPIFYTRVLAIIASVLDFVAWVPHLDSSTLLYRRMSLGWIIFSSAIILYYSFALSEQIKAKNRVRSNNKLLNKEYDVKKIYKLEQRIHIDVEKARIFDDDILDLGYMLAEELEPYVKYVYPFESKDAINVQKFSAEKNLLVFEKDQRGVSKGEIKAVVRNDIEEPKLVLLDKGCVLRIPMDFDMKMLA